MRDNPVKHSLRAGGRAYGAMVFEFFSAGMPQICGNAGAEFVLYDMEHTGLGFETLKTQCALCRGLDIVPMARVPRGEYHFVARALQDLERAPAECRFAARVQDIAGQRHAESVSHRLLHRVFLRRHPGCPAARNRSRPFRSASCSSS